MREVMVSTAPDQVVTVPTSVSSLNVQDGEHAATLRLAIFPGRTCESVNAVLQPLENLRKCTSITTVTQK
jgi:hypothetical protein